MGCGSGGCSSGGCSSGGCSSGGCNKLNTFDWLAEMDLPPHMKPFDIVEVRFKGTRKEFYKSSLVDFFTNEFVVVEAENGYDIGKVSLLNFNLKNITAANMIPILEKLCVKLQKLILPNLKKIKN